MKEVSKLPQSQAKKFFLKSESYAYFDLPKYFTFEKLLTEVDKKFKGKSLSDLCIRGCNPKDNEGVNYTLLNNKDGKYDWRPFQLIHPVLYVALVNSITTKESWMLILEKIHNYQKNNLVECMSWPTQSENNQSDKANLVSVWWEKVEQKSLELALDFDYVCQTDISNCYGSIYTHVIPWALHTKKIAKKKDQRNNGGLVGNRIDQLLRAMSYGQTNGIPQGSVLMDFIAEIVLGYIDDELTKKIRDNGVDFESFKIIRYKDDYRFFTNNPAIIEQIVKLLTEVLLDMGMKLNAEKTITSDNVLTNSLKKDKIYWIENEIIYDDFLKEIQSLHFFADRFQNSGTLEKQLQKYDGKMKGVRKIKNNVLVLISYIVDIALKNPRTYTVCTSILSKLLSFVSTKEAKTEILNRILKKFKKIPNTDFFEIWIQRMVIKLDIKLKLDAKLCRIVDGEIVNLWNSEWLVDDMKVVLNSIPIVDRDIIDTLDPIINPDEVKLFEYN